MKHIKIFRTAKPNCTIGSGYVYYDTKIQFSFKTLELPWKNNERRVSCIPKGIYTAKKHQSPKFKQCFWLQDVPGRSEVLVHIGNFTREILGCILVGDRHVHLDSDGIIDVSNSRKTLEELYKIMPDEFEIHIS